MKLEIELKETDTLFHRGKDITSFDTSDSNGNLAAIITIRNEMGPHIMFQIQRWNEDDELCEEKLLKLDLGHIAIELLEKLLEEEL